MSRSYRRRYYRRRKNSGVEGIFGIAIILAAITYNYGDLLNRALTYAVITGLVVLGVILVVRIWKWRNARQHKIPPSFDADVNSMTGVEFERYVAARLREKGYTDIRLTEHYDLGIDIIAHKNGITWGIQVKRCSGLVKVIAVRQAVAALKHYKCDRAMVITNGAYSGPAIKLAKSNGCILVSHIG